MYYSIDAVNAAIPIFSGTATFKQEKYSCATFANIYHKWLPSAGLYADLSSLTQPFGLGPAELVLKGRSYPVHIISISANSDRKTVAVADFAESAVFGSLEIESHLFFNLFNFLGYVGSCIGTSKNTMSWSRDRIEFSLADSIITIDKRIDYSDRLKELKALGGYITTHQGFIENLHGRSQIMISKRMNCLQYFLAFLNGAWCGPLIVNQNNTFLYYRNTFHSPYEYRHSLVTILNPFPIFNLSMNFSHFYFDKYWSLIIRRLIHTYIVCNDSSQLTVEMGLALIQTSLESMAYIFLVEVAGASISKRKYEKLSASLRIKYLLEKFRIPTQIPQSLQSLGNTGARLRLNNGPDILTKLRNLLVHPTKKNREEFDAFDATSKIEAWILAMWYFELCLLHLLGYRGNYCSRVKDNQKRTNERTVPWL
jgi:hypothetical protein